MNHLALKKVHWKGLSHNYAARPIRPRPILMHFLQPTRVQVYAKYIWDDSCQSPCQPAPRHSTCWTTQPQQPVKCRGLFAPVRLCAGHGNFMSCVYATECIVPQPWRDHHYYSKRHNFDRDLALPAHCCLNVGDFDNYYALDYQKKHSSNVTYKLFHILCQNQSVIDQSRAQPLHCKTTQLRHSRQTTTSCIMKCHVRYFFILNLWLATSRSIQKTPHCQCDMELCILLV